MVNRCVICGCKYKSEENRSFHRIPVKIERQRIWLERIIKYLGKENIPKYSTVCSDHFVPTDFIIKPSGKICLKESAIPELPNSRKHPEFTDEEFESVPIKRPKYSVVSESSITTSSPSSSSATLTASEILDINSDIENNSKINQIQTLYRGTQSKTEISPQNSSSSKKSKSKKTVRKKKISPKDKKIKYLLQQIKRLQTRVKKIKAEYGFLKEKYNQQQNVVNTKETLPGLPGIIFDRINNAEKKYPPLLRAFAITLHFYSAKAYCYVREKMYKVLPHPTTISRWFMSIDGSSGFNEMALRTIKTKATELAEKGHQVICNLVMDEMSIMKHIQWTGKKYMGYVDIESALKKNKDLRAKEVLVFMLVAINGHWKVPIAYFFTNGLTGDQKADLVRKLLDFLKESKIIISSLTFDGHSTNFFMANKLGANFDNSESLVTSFQNTCSNGEVFIFLDICHMLKLVRNTLGTVKILQDGDGHFIKWDYFELLCQIQIDEGLLAGTKFKNRHVNWVRDKMKVKLAAQTFSSSVSDAMAFFRQDLKLESFKDSAATEKFCKIFNNLFDIFNSQSKFSKYIFKRCLSPSNYDCIENYLSYCRDYILNLKYEGESVLNISRKTGFLGFLISIESLRMMYKTFVTEKQLLKYLLTYKLSQDHLEVFFSAVRSKGGHCNNPTAKQFEYIYKRLMVRTEIKSSESANCIIIDPTSILYISSITKSIDDGKDLCKSNDFKAIFEEVQNAEFLNSDIWHLTPYLNDVVAYISGFVVKCLKKCVTCESCLNILETTQPLSKLQIRKQYGKLISASPFVVEICRLGEKSIKYLKIKEKLLNNNKVIDMLKLLTARNISSEIMQYFGDHILDNDIENNHWAQLINLILQKYFTIRIHHETMKLHDESAKERVRRMLTKTILFKNQ